MNKVTALSLYVDDLVLTRNDPLEMEKLKRQLVKEFEIKDPREAQILPRDISCTL